MIGSYLKIAWRNLQRNRGFTLINILGLCAGLTCFTLIMLYVRSESGYDTFHEHSENIYRVALERKYPGRSRHYAIIPHSYGQAFKSEFPEVEDACRLFNFGNFTYFKYAGEAQEETRVMWADSTFFDFFSIPVLEGDPRTMLDAPNSIVLTETKAIKYFGEDWKNKNVVGEVMDIIDNDNDPIVTGVCADIPNNSHLVADFIRSSTALNFLENLNYLSFSSFTYLRLNAGADPASLEKKFPDAVVKYASGQVLEHFGVDYAQYQKQGNGYRYFLQPLEGIYLDSNLEGEMKPHGSRSRISFFILIAILIIGIAAINFMNLSTARSAGRAREVGIRKTLGSLRRQLIGQFLFEAVVIAMVGGVLALVATVLLLPFFNDLTQKQMTVQEVFAPGFILFYLLVVLLSGVLSGLYPALFLSKFSPLQAIRGRLIQNVSGFGLRNGLVVFQFCISVFLIATTMMVYRQLKFTQDKDLGFDKESVVALKGTASLTAVESETFRVQLLDIPGVIAAGGCSNQPGESFPGTSWKPEGASEMTTGSLIWVDANYLECMEMDLLAGRTFSEDFADSNAVLINQAALAEMNLQDPIGKMLSTKDNFLSNGEEPASYTIVGVVEDYHFQSLHHSITPLFFVHNSKNFIPGVNNQMSVRLAGSNWPATLARIEQLWKKIEPETPFRHAFLDNEWAELYEQEITSRKVFSVFSLLAIFIACLGLFALANYMTEQRLKEIGIRKVLGASVTGIVSLLSKNFLMLVGIAVLIAIPLSYYFLNQWLNEFAYRANLSWWIFAVAGIIAISIAAITVSYTSLKAAVSNPMKSLSNE